MCLSTQSLVLFSIALCSQLRSTTAQYTDDDQVVEIDASGNAHAISSKENPSQVDVTFKNSCSREVDVRWDDGVFGKAVAHRLAHGDEISISTFYGHLFTWTEHGTTRPLSPPMKIVHGKSSYELTDDIVKQSVEEMKCADRFPKYCQDNAQRGECNNAPGWMIVHCPKSCNRCELQDPQVRCKRSSLDMIQAPAWQPGDLNKMFERIMTGFPQYNTTALSRPPAGPWLLRFDNFIAPHEARRLIDLNKHTFQRSTDQGAINEFGEMQKVVSQSRTSTNSWCDHNCERDLLVSQIYQKIVDVTGIPRVNYESFQVLQYQKGQFYRVHHDDSGGDTNAAGPRILTFFLYLSDVEEGGETDFPNIGVRASPKAGSAILWPSMSDEDPQKSDPRMYHQAMPVKKGVKYAANAWIHLYNYKVPNLWGCTGSFS